MKHVAFLRGINVGGNNKIEMKALREVFGALGFENVKTYINSGNIIFETVENDRLSARIETAIEAKFSLRIKTMTRSAAEIRDIIENNPFAGQYENDKDLHVLFLDEELPADKRELLLSNNNENERFAVRKREIFCLLRAGVADSLLGKGFVDKKLKTPATARNWRTVKKIAEL
jgi:uncharacterized protein (DUF1697 family)